MCEVERNMSYGGCRGILFEVSDDLPKQTGDEILKRIAAIREKIVVAAGAFDLEKRCKEASRDTIGKVSYCWEILEGAKARHLRGYGEVAEGLAEVLDPQLDEIIALVDQIHQLAKEISMEVASMDDPGGE